MLQWLKDLLKVITLRGYWIIIAVPTIITVSWLVFAWLLNIENDIVRTLAIWLFILIPTCLSALAKGADWKEAVYK